MVWSIGIQFPVRPVIRIFFSSPRRNRLWGSSSLLSSESWWGVREAYHSHPCSARVKNAWP